MIKKYRLLIFVCYLLCVSTMCIKTVYSCEVVEIISQLGETKARVGLGLTLYYAIYTVTQVAISSYMKKMDVAKYTLVTLLLSAVLYGIIPFTTDLWQLWIILALNGFLQATSYGGCIHFFDKFLPDDMMGTASKIMATNMALGTFLAYGVSAAFVGAGLWKFTFLFFSAIMFVATIAFYVTIRRFQKILPMNETCVLTREKQSENSKDVKENDETANKLTNKGVKFKTTTVFLIVGMLIVVFVSLTNYCLSNWLPSFLKEIFHVSSAYSIFITLFMPLVAMFGAMATVSLCEKGKNTFSVGMIMCLPALVITVAMCFIYHVSMLLSFVMIVLIIFAVRGLTSLMVTYLPLLLHHEIDSGKMSLLMNAAASAGAAIIPLTSGAVLDHYGWTMLFVLNVICVALGLGLLPVAKKIQKRL